MKKLALFLSRRALGAPTSNEIYNKIGAPSWKIAQNFANDEKHENQKNNSNKHHNENSDQEEF